MSTQRQIADLSPDKPQLFAIEQDWAVSARSNPGLLDSISNAIGGPFHLIYPPQFVKNLTEFRDVLSRRGVQGRVYFGKKANKAGAWLTELANADGHVDVASSSEFAHALANGIRGDHVVVTGAAKCDHLLWLANRHGALVAIDSIDELERAVQLASHGSPLRILLRVLSPENPNSRFGLDRQGLEAAMQFCSAYRDIVDMTGFSFHLDGYQVEPRAKAAHSLLDLCIRARAMGLDAASISIGGGFACSYVDQSDWIRFHAALDATSFHCEKTFSKFYPFYQSPVGAHMLDRILAWPLEKNSLGVRLKDLGVELYIEPGRALLDGAGMTVFPVQGFKIRQDYGIITVAGLSMSLSDQWKNSEFLPNPILVERGRAREQRPVFACVAGSSCLEYDVLTWRKIAFPAQPRHGDLLVYPNTAGYQMDKNESEFHQLRLPPKVVLAEANGSFTWRMDE